LRNLRKSATPALAFADPAAKAKTLLETPPRPAPPRIVAN
jgi:hypothetical protein